MVLLAHDIGMAPGEYAFIFFFQLVGDPVVGEYTWERGDQLDMVGYLLILIAKKGNRNRKQNDSHVLFLQLKIWPSSKSYS